MGRASVEVYFVSIFFLYTCEYTPTIRHDAPNVRGGRFDENFARTTPEFPWVRVQRPQITRTLVPLTAFLPL